MNDRPEQLAGLARMRDGEIDGAKEAAERAKFIAATRTPRQTARPRKVLALAAALTVAVAVAIVAWPEAALDLTVDGAALAEAGYVRADDAPAELRFSDGTTVVLRPGSAARVVSVTAHGAELLLEQGQATLHVQRRDGAAWSVAAGPYAIRVTGTSFDVAWAPRDEVFGLDLRQGSVEVRGPQLDAPLAVKAGTRMVAHVRQRDVQLGPLVDVPPPASGGPSDGASAVAPATPSASASVAAIAAPSATPAKRLSWAQLVADGDYARVLEEADARGVDSVLRGGSAGQLVALADAARYQGRGSLARRCLLALHEHHTGHPAATSAAFLLGRMSEGSPQSAIGWYDRYLAAAPGGAYAAEALGRKLTLTAQANPKAARGLAKQYLAAYPSGAYAALARKLLR
jgi:FecR protein